MNARWIILVCILKIHLKAITPQHHHHHHYYDDTLQQYDDDDEPDDSRELSSEYIARRRTKTKTDSEECNCASCFSREGPKFYCIDFCKYCHTDTAIPNQNPYPNHEQKVVFVPFPYPLIVPNNALNEDAMTEKPQTTEETTTSTTKVDEPTSTAPTQTTSQTTEKPKPTTKPVARVDRVAKPKNTKLRVRSKSVELGMLSRHRQMKQLNPAVKRTRPAWVPKYGIVPIPDHLAAKLMTQLTEVRALKAKKF